MIKPTVESIRTSTGASIRCHRADKETRPEDIITHIVENLVTAEIVVADLSGRNANVFYELGVRHAVANNTILIAENVEDIPFDLRGLRTIAYRYDPEQMLSLRVALEQAVCAIIANPDKIDNPVRRFLYDIQVKELLKRTTPPGYDVLNEILGEVVSLRKEIDHHRHEVRRFTESVTRSNSQGVTLESGPSRLLETITGMWQSEEDSLFCARLVGGELRVPYCYGGEDRLTAHFYSCVAINDTFYAKFQWFNSQISGFAFFRREDDDHLVGGWWYAQDVPEEVKSDLSQLRLSTEGMVPSRWTRLKRKGGFPNWAEEYFQNKLG